MKGAARIFIVVVLVGCAASGVWVFAGSAAGERVGMVAARMSFRPGTEFAERLGVEPILIPGGHMTLLTDPETVRRRCSTRS